MAKEPSRFSELPAEAEWVEYKSVWVLGATNASLNKEGLWRSWKPNYLFIVENYENGQLHGDYLKNFKTGQPAAQAHYQNGKLQGKATYYHSDNEANPAMPKTFGGKVRKADVYYHEGKALYMLFYDKQGAVVDVFGRPRHKSVPTEARWKNRGNQWEQNWELANYENGLLQGLCQRWDAETGKLIYEATFEQDNVVGKCIEYYKNGELRSETEYKDGNPVSPHFWYRCSDNSLSMGTFYSNDSAKIWKKEITYKEGERLDTAEVRYFLKDGRLCRQNGLPLSDMSLAAFFVGEPNDFLSQQLGPLLRRWLGDKFKGIDTAASQANKAAFRRFYGMDMPTDLALYFDLMAAANYPELYGNLHTAAYPFAQLQAWEDTGKNIVEMSIRAMQNNFPFDYWVDWITGSISLDKLWMEQHNSYNVSYLYELEKNNPVSFWTHNDPRDYYGLQMQGTFSSNLSQFLYFIFACHAHSHLGALSDSEAMAALVKVRPKANFNYNFINAYPLEMGINPLWRINPSVEQGLASIHLGTHRWLLELLRGELDMSDVFRRTLSKDQIIIIEQTLKTTTNRTFSQNFQWLWTAFFLSNDSLPDAIAACRQHPSFLLQQAADLVQQLAEGRKQLGILHIDTAKAKLLNS